MKGLAKPRKVVKRASLCVCVCFGKKVWIFEVCTGRRSRLTFQRGCRGAECWCYTGCAIRVHFYILKDYNYPLLKKVALCRLIMFLWTPLHK